MSHSVGEATNTVTFQDKRYITVYLYILLLYLYIYIYIYIYIYCNDSSPANNSPSPARISATHQHENEHYFGKKRLQRTDEYTKIKMLLLNVPFLFLKCLLNEFKCM